MTENAKASGKNLTTPLLVGLLVIAAFLIGSLWTKNKTQSGEKTTAPTAKVTAAPEQALTVENLKKYAKEFKLDTKNFDACLDNGEKAAAVKAEADYGNSIGVQGTPGFFVNGRFVGGAYPFDIFKELIDKELAGEGSTNASAYSKTLQDAAKDGAFIPKPIKVEIADSPTQGPEDAKVTIVEFSDFQCPFCSRGWTAMKQVESAYKDQVKFVFKQLPLSFHQYAQKAAEASLCAADQGKFWEYADKLFLTQTTSQ